MALSTFGAALGHVHLQDVDGYADRHWHPGEGRIHWSPVLRSIEAMTEAPHLILEVRRNAQNLPKTVAWLETLTP